MPRLNNSNYLQRRHQLMRLYGDNAAAFSHLEARAQQDLHVYFQTTNLGTDAELLAERSRLTAEDSSLPQRAGRAYAALTNPDKFRRPAPVHVTAGGRGIYIRGVMRPEPDVEQLARALLKLADELNKRDREDKAA